MKESTNTSKQKSFQEAQTSFPKLHPISIIFGSSELEIEDLTTNSFTATMKFNANFFSNKKRKLKNFPHKIITRQNVVFQNNNFENSMPFYSNIKL